MYIDYGHTQMCVLPDDTSFWCRDAYDVEMVKPGARVFHILSIRHYRDLTNRSDISQFIIHLTMQK